MPLRWPDALLMLALAGFGAQGQMLELCDQLVTSPAGDSPLALARYQAQLVRLQDQLRALPQPGEHQANCYHKVSRALARFSGQRNLPLPLLSAQADYLLMAQDNRRAIQINRERCQRAGMQGEQARVLPLSKREVGRYLFQAADSSCARSVWLAWQNRGGDQADSKLAEILTLSHQQARSMGYPSTLAWRLDGAYLNSYPQAEQFLSGLVATATPLPWQRPNTPRYRYIDPPRLARATLMQLTRLLGLSLQPLGPDQWQLWDGRRYLGQLGLIPGDRSHYWPVQRHLVGHFTGMGQILYRQNERWRGEHLSELVASITEALYHLAGHSLAHYRAEEQEPDLAGLPRAIGLALGAEPGFVRLLPQAPDVEPLAFGPGELLRARLALAFWHQASHQPARLDRYQAGLFARYYGQPAPQGWKPLSAYPNLVEQGPLIYGSLLAKKTAMDLIDQWRSGSVSGPQLWEQLFVNSNHRAFAPSLAQLGLGQRQ
ncbi:hypothetical protein FCL40_05340 [Ferrimonas sediminicola]|uniref:Uncharacterized protein n=1 Tax=Ferrimonas sediminicola TaxID=2569538 RepID=A0A4U1BH46_9GAMM|nr:hypothetical protein [Ferrimonas sediminicola]TKB50575.1 hypothetical protein FCL40_05340 [Ferrimonas sediminicola]